MEFYNQNKDLFINNNKWTNNKALNPPFFPRPVTLYEINAR
jgi:hypothetical protein